MPSVSYSKEGTGPKMPVLSGWYSGQYFVIDIQILEEGKHTVTVAFPHCDGYEMRLRVDMSTTGQVQEFEQWEALDLVIMLDEEINLCGSYSDD
jgi:hypothetical protein